MQGLLWIPILAAQAPGGAPPGGGGLFGPMGYMILLLGIMYFLIFRPQQQKQKEHRQMVSRLKAGDRVVTTGGIHGVVAGVEESTLMLRVADGVEIKLVRSAVGSVIEEASADGKPESGEAEEVREGRDAGVSRAVDRARRRRRR
ncbi:MAG: preprotein translocase subunit YajC [Lentisphaeria bacterium]|nr:preprotein translocase subunit YajC [Lentisphaeria bacterium]